MNFMDILFAQKLEQKKKKKSIMKKSLLSIIHYGSHIDNVSFPFINTPGLGYVNNILSYINRFH